MILCTRSAALAKCVSCFKGLLRPCEPPNANWFWEGEINLCPRTGRKSYWVTRESRMEGTGGADH